jgi:N-acetylneuraminate lyase
MTKHLKGLIAAPFTPMDTKGNLNLSVIPDYYLFLKHNGISGAFICGTTGEGVSLTLGEKKAVCNTWSKAISQDKDFKVILFVGGTCIEDCKELALHARDRGIYAISFTPPFYFKPTDIDILTDCCKEIADAVPEMPFYFYHIPSLTGVDFPMIDLLKNVDGKISNFKGIKYTAENFMDFLSCLHFQNGKYDMLWGRDENLLSSLVLGCNGAVGSTYNYAAPLYFGIINAFKSNDLAKAQRLQQQSVDMISLLGKYGGIATGKSYMKLVGLDCGEFRLPVKNMTEKEFQLFKEDTEKINFKAFSSTI